VGFGEFLFQDSSGTKKAIGTNNKSEKDGPANGSIAQRTMESENNDVQG